MRLRGIGRLTRWLRRATAPFRSQAVILLYHRAFETPSDPQLLCIHPRHFAEHLEYLTKHYRVISLHELVNALKNGAVPQRAVVVTFDDGYVDNLWNAKPLLERYEIPATVFITTGYVGLNHEFWWDKLERLLLLSPSLPEHLTVTLNGTCYTWHLGEASDGRGFASAMACGASRRPNSALPGLSGAMPIDASVRIWGTRNSA